MMFPLPIAERRVDRFRQPAADAWRRLQPIDDDFDVVPHLAIEREIVGERHDPAIDAGPHEALLAQVLEQVFVFALLAADDGRQHGELRARSASAMIRAMICSRVWAVIGRPHCGQCPWPTRA